MQLVPDSVARSAGRPDLLLVALQEIQSRAGYIPEESIVAIASSLGITAGEVRSVISFYDDLRTVPPGEHHLCVCMGDSCAALGSRQIADAVEEQLDARPGGMVTFDRVFCLGNCALSPSISLDGEVYGRTTPEKVVKHLQELGDA